MHDSLVHHLLNRLWTIIGVGAAVAILSIAASFFFPLEYRADAQVLIISRSRYGVDPYTVVKSAEQIGQNVVQVVGTNDFYQKVMTEPGFTVDQSQFQNVSERIKRKRWKKALEGSVVYGTGVLTLSAYNTVPASAATLAAAAASALVSHGVDYVGGDVTMKIVNDPVVTRFPARPNIPLNALVGFVAGALLASLSIARKSVRHLS